MGRKESSHEGVDCSGTDSLASPTSISHPIDDKIGQLLVSPQLNIVDFPGAVVSRGSPITLEDRRDIVDHHGVLLPLVLRVGEHERKEFLLAEFSKRPVEAPHTLVTCRDVRAGIWIALAGRSVDRHGIKSPMRKIERLVETLVFLAKLRVFVIEEQKILALDVEDQRLRIDSLRAQNA